VLLLLAASGQKGVLLDRDAGDVQGRVDRREVERDLDMWPVQVIGAAAECGGHSRSGLQGVARDGFVIA